MTGRLEFVPCDARAEVDVETTVTHLCPFADEIDRGRLYLAWRTRTETVELHSLGRYLAGYASKRVSHEEMTARVAADLAAASGLDLVSVRTVWQTAGQSVDVSWGPW